MSDKKEKFLTRNYILMPAVSYTHLDVYKRQVEMIEKRIVLWKK